MRIVNLGLSPLGGADFTEHARGRTPVQSETVSRAHRLGSSPYKADEPIARHLHLQEAIEGQVWRHEEDAKSLKASLSEALTYGWHEPVSRSNDLITLTLDNGSRITVRDNDKSKLSQRFEITGTTADGQTISTSVSRSTSSDYNNYYLFRCLETLARQK